MDNARTGSGSELGIVGRDQRRTDDRTQMMVVVGQRQKAQQAIWDRRWSFVPATWLPREVDVDRVGVILYVREHRRKPGRLSAAAKAAGRDGNHGVGNAIYNTPIFSAYAMQMPMRRPLLLAPLDGNTRKICETGRLGSPTCGAGNGEEVYGARLVQIEGRRPAGCTVFFTRSKSTRPHPKTEK